MRIIVCVTGSIACIEVPKLLRELLRRGHDAHCALSSSACSFVSPETFRWALGKDVITKLDGANQHIRLTNGPLKADLVLVAPCTSNTIAKIAAGIDDTVVTTIAAAALGSSIPIMIIPSMHMSLYNHPILQENIKKLKKYGIDFISPKFEENKAKFPELSRIIDIIDAKFTKKDLKNKKILVTAGSTIEPIDAVRYIANRSSGKMGIALANEAFARGAEVTLIRGMTAVEPKFPYRDIKITTANDMYEAIKKHSHQDVIIHAAAVSDFNVSKHSRKLSSKNKLQLELKPNKKIINEIKKLNRNVFLVGFKAEYMEKDMIKNSFDTLKKSNADLICANDISKKNVGFSYDTNEITIINKEKEAKKLKLAHKKIIANQILDELP